MILIPNPQHLPIQMKKIGFSFLFSLFLLASCQQAPTYRFELYTTDVPLPRTPIVIDLPAQLASYTSFKLMYEGGSKAIPIQEFDQNQWMFILDSSIPQDTIVKFVLQPVKEAQQASKVKLERESEKLTIHIGDKPVLSYFTEVQQPPEGSPAYYQRSGFIHPLYSPGGQVLTNDFPADHMHQHGIFLAMVNTTFQDQSIDFWNQQNKTGTVTHVEVIDTISGPVFAGFTCRLQHLAIPENDTTIVLDEIWQVNVYNVDTYFVWDITSTLTCAAEEALHMNEYHYGGMAFRASAQWFDPDYQPNEDSMANYLGEGQGGFITREGKTRIDGNHARPYWVDMHGMIDGEPVGVCIMDHPNNFRYPQPVRIHPSMPYFCFAPMVLGPFDIEPEEIYRSSYRFISHQGAPDTTQLNTYWQAYVEQPRIKWLR